MTYRLFLDDERFPAKGEWIIARTADEARAIVAAKGWPDFISFDHDLGEGETGKDFAQWLVDYALDQGRFDPAMIRYDIHSQNLVGANRIRGLLDGLIRFLEGEKNVRDDDEAEGGSS